MTPLPDIQSLTHFQRNAKAVIRTLDRSQSAAVLTVNGKARAVVMSPKAFETLSRQAELAASVRVLGQRLAKPAPLRAWTDIRARIIKPAKANATRRSA